MDRSTWRATIHGLQSQPYGVGRPGIPLLAGLRKSPYLLKTSESQQFDSLYLGQNERGNSWENDLQLSWDDNRA